MSVGLQSAGTRGGVQHIRSLPRAILMGYQQDNHISRESVKKKRRKLPCGLRFGALVALYRLEIRAQAIRRSLRR